MPVDPTRSRFSRGDDPTLTYDPAFDAGLAAAFGGESTPGGWSRPPLLRDDPSDPSPIVRPNSADMPQADPARLQLFGEIARGGMGVIFKGRDPLLGRDLAIKALKSEYAGRASAEERFQEEAQVGGQLQHPGIVPVYDMNRFEDGRPYFTMKLVKGRTLAALLAERKGPGDDRGRFLKVFEQVAQTIAYAHSRGVIHRDLKPANVMVGNFGEVQVMDWGLAKVLSQGGVTDELLASREHKRPEEYEPTIIRTARVGSVGSDTQAGSILGTLAFMPPEQAGGEIDKLDERADVFGLGAILCVILTGDPPYVGDDGEAVRLLAIRGKLDSAFARLDACGADPELAGLANRCLAPEREDRPRHAGDVNSEIAIYLYSVEERARRAEVERAAAEARATEQGKRRKVQAVLGLASTALVVLGGVFAWWTQDQRIKTEREVFRVVKDAVAKFGRASGAGRDPALWAEARAAARTAEVRATEADAPAEVRDRVRGLVDEAERAEKNHRFIATLLESHAAMGDVLNSAGWQDYSLADGRYKEAFREYGADLFVMTPEAAADLLRGLAGDVRVELAAAIDGWADVRFADQTWYSGPRVDYPTPFFRVTRLLDPDPVRNRIRDLIAGKNRAGLVRFAEEIDPSAHPLQTVTLVGASLYRFRAGAREAVRFLQRAQPHHPADFQINHHLAWCLLRQRRWADALPYSVAAIALRSKSAAAWDDYGHALDGVGRLAEAAAAHRRVYTLSPSSLSSRLFEIDSRTRAGDRIGAAAARAEFHKLTSLKSDLGKAYSAFANARWASGDQAVAEVALREAVGHDPNNADYHSFLGDLLKDRKDTEGAKNAYLEAIRLNPNNFLSHHNLGNVLREQRRDMKGAENAYREAIRLFPAFAWSHFELGRVLITTRHLTGAAAEFDKVIQLDPSADDLLDRTARILAAGPDGVRDGKRAVELSTRACELNEWKTPRFLDTLAAAYAEVGDFEKAVEFQKRAVAALEAVKGNGPGFRARLALYEQKQPFRDPTLAPHELAPPPRAKR